jgi:hypothetical protein
MKRSSALNNFMIVVPLSYQVIWPMDSSRSIWRPWTSPVGHAVCCCNFSTHKYLKNIFVLYFCFFPAWKADIFCSFFRVLSTHDHFEAASLCIESYKRKVKKQLKKLSIIIYQWNKSISMCHHDQTKKKIPNKIDFFYCNTSIAAAKI